MTRVLDGSVDEYLEQLGSGAAVPGGGSAAGLAGAMGVALLGMVARISARKLGDKRDGPRLLELVAELDQLRARLGKLSQDDIDAYRGVIEARKRGLPPPDLERAYAQAAEVPLETARAADRGLSIFPEVSRSAWEMTRSDLEAGQALLQVSLKVALANVAINLPELSDATRTRLEREYAELAARRQQ
ncbi:MAG TPA: cyclodeaminase/cyclohydrolase family protein [Candidatus Dormibacteraeota bacterium]